MQTPKEIDIPELEPPSGSAFATQVMREIAKAAQVGESSHKPNDDAAIMSRALILITGQTWRLKNVMIDPDSTEMKTALSAQEMRKVSNALEAIDQAIQELGIRVIDRCNEDFHPGLPDQVVTEEPREGISKEQIIRTIRPTIMWHQTMMQRGEIDLAVPISK